MNEYWKIFESDVDDLGLNISDIQTQQFQIYYEYMIETNKVMNLTTITEYKDVLKKHFLDSLLCVKTVDVNHFHSLIDVGTGAGFPGIPLKIMFPNLEICLLDSLNKRIKFLNDIIYKLELKKIYTIHSRAEEAAKNTIYREKFDLCVSRAVSNLSTLVEYCLPFVKRGGRFISYKSGIIQDEVNSAQTAIKVMGGRIDNITYFDIPGTDLNRSLVNIKKINNTPAKYPRKSGTPLKEPISKR